MNLPQKIKSMRLSMNMTQQQFATCIGISVSAIRQYESGARTPKYKTVHLACKSLGIPIMSFEEYYELATGNTNEETLNDINENKPNNLFYALFPENERFANYLTSLEIQEDGTYVKQGQLQCLTIEEITLLKSSLNIVFRRKE